MDTSRLYLVGDLPGFTPHIARLVSMMSYARHTTLAEVRGLTVAQLDHLHDADSNTIGALLLHMAAVEVGYQAATFEGRDLSGEEVREWGAAIRLGARGRREIRGRELDFYTGKLDEVRRRTLAELARRDDGWLSEETSFWNGLRANNYFKWFHVFEDELNHRGQIRFLRKRLPDV